MTRQVRKKSYLLVQTTHRRPIGRQKVHVEKSIVEKSIDVAGEKVKNLTSAFKMQKLNFKTLLQ